MKTFEELFREQMEVEAEIIHLQERSKQLTAEMMRSAGLMKRSTAIELASGDTVILSDGDFKLEVLEGK